MTKHVTVLIAVGLVTAALVLASSLPTFAARGTTKAKGQGETPGVGASTCTVVTGTAYPTIQSAVDDVNCETIQVPSGKYSENVSIDRDVTIIGVQSETLIVGAGVDSGSILTILPGSTVTLQNIVALGGFATQGGGIHNQGTLTLDNVSTFENTAYYGGGIYNEGTLTLGNETTVSGNTANSGGGIYNEGTLTLDDGSSVITNAAAKDGGGIYNEGTLYVCIDPNDDVYDNEAPPATTNDFGGDPAQECPTAPPPGDPEPGKKGERVMVDHRNKKELCLSKAALKGHLKHGDEIVDEEGCPDTEQGR